MQDSLNNAEYNVADIKRTPFYFGPKNKRLIGWLHTHADSHFIKDTGVIICPPIGVEYMSTYRSMRYAADYFALSGIPAIRFDYHGTGDSSGLNEDDNRLEDWLWSIEEATVQLKLLTGCGHVGLFGLRIGGTLASIVATKIHLSFLVLWAAPESGHKYIREVKMAQMAGVSQAHTLVNDQFIEAGGAIYYPQTVNDLTEIELCKLVPDVDRVLIVPRDDLNIKNNLRDSWTEAGIEVEQKEFKGSADMLLSGYIAVVPHESIMSIVNWVNENEAISLQDNKLLSLPDLRSSVLIEHYHDKENNSKYFVKETIVRYGEAGQCFGILTEPAETINSALPIIIIANSGVTHRVGPSRLYVLLARQLCELGFRCFRIDMSGIGDSVVADRAKENLEYINTSSEEILAAIQALSSNYLDFKYVVMGLCSGAYFSFHASIDLENIDICECVLINPLTFYWEGGAGNESSKSENFNLWGWYKKAIIRPGSWIKLLKGKINIREFSTMLIMRGRIVLKIKAKHMSQFALGANENRHYMDLDWDLDKIANNNTHILFVLSRNDPGYDILMTTAGKTAKKLTKQGSLTLKFIENADHTFSKYQPRCDVINAIKSDLISRYLRPS